MKKGLVLTLLLGGCAAGIPRSPVVSAPLTQISDAQIQTWVARAGSAIDQSSALYFEWQYVDGRKQDASGGGPGSIRFAPPDSIRLDFRLPLGAGRGAAMVVGDSIHWARPEDRMNELIPEYHLLWALTGAVRMPKRGSTVRGATDAGVRVWEYLSDADTVQYAREDSPPSLFVLVRREGQEVGRVKTMFDSEGRPEKASLFVPSAQIKLELRYNRFTIPAVIPEELWRVPVDSL